MILQLSLLGLFVFSLLLPPASPSLQPLSPKCPTQCRNLSIPYPFGIEASWDDLVIGIGEGNIGCCRKTIPRDINECDDNVLNPCDIDANSICSNTLGSVNCSCPKGDGQKNGKGCIPTKSSVGYVMGLLLLRLMGNLLDMFLQKRRNKILKEKFFKRNSGLLLKQQTNEGTVQKIKLFSVEELEKATDNFNKSRILRRVGQGTVYKGMLSDGKIVAIKKSRVINKDHLEQFINETVRVSQIVHKNVVKLWGCCLETEVPLLVYELVPNGTLFDLIHDPDAQFHVPWNMHLQIASDVAAALAYLHSALSVPIYHRDIKSNNILLDEKYTVKLSGFGISSLVEKDRTHSTTTLKGTFWYFDPEYFQSMQFTEKSEVYSFGVVLVELLTGQRPVSLDVNEEEGSLVIRFLESMEENKFHTMLDPQVSKDEDDEVIACSCLSRPKMLEFERENETDHERSGHTIGKIEVM